MLDPENPHAGPAVPQQPMQYMVVGGAGTGMGSGAGTGAAAGAAAAAAGGGAAAGAADPAAKQQCAVCLSDESDTPDLQVLVVYPCGHRCICTDCVEAFMALPEARRNCPQCRGPVKDIIRVFG